MNFQTSSLGGFSRAISGKRAVGPALPSAFRTRTALASFSLLSGSSGWAMPGGSSAASQPAASPKAARTNASRQGLGVAGLERQGKIRWPTAVFSASMLRRCRTAASRYWRTASL